MEQQYDVLYKGTWYGWISAVSTDKKLTIRSLCVCLFYLAVVLVGDPSVGKTNLLATFLASAEDANGRSSEGGGAESNSNTTNSCKNLNADGSAKGFSSVRKPTIGVEFGTKVVQHPNGKRIKAQIWDTGTLSCSLLPLYVYACACDYAGL